MNSRSAQLLAATLAFLLIVLIGATIFVLLSRPAPRPTATPSVLPTTSLGPSPSTGFSPSPSPTPSPTIGPTPTLLPTAAPTETPTSEPSPTTPPTPSPTPSPSPTPTPTLPPPTSPQRELTLVEVGLDRRADLEGVERTVTFVIDGPSLISAQLSDVSAGKVRLCLSRQATDPQRECRTTRNGSLERAVFDSGRTEWNVTMIGTTQAFPFATLTLRFNALSPSVHVDSFRFNGTVDPHYNGFVARLTAGGDGNLRIQATFADTDQSQDDNYPYHLVITPVGGGPAVVDQTGGPQGSLDVSFGLATGQTYRVELSEPEETAGGGLFAVFVDATLTWP